MSWVITGSEKTPVDKQGIQNVSLLLHGNGTNGSTTITDSSPSPKTITRLGDAQISTAQSKFGGASIAFDGTGDYLQVQDSSFAFGTNNFTLEFWVYFPSGFTHVQGMSPVYIGGNVGSVFSPFSIRNNAGTVVSYIWGNSVWSIAADRPFTTLVRDTWLHWAISRSGSTWYTFENGILKNTWVNAESINNPGGGNILTIARAATDGQTTIQCYVDEFRITNGIARYQSTFTPPTAPFPDI